MRSCFRCLPLLLLGCVTAGDPSPQTAPGTPNLLPRSAGVLSESDVVLVLDQSTPGLLASGLDVDGDGVVGRTHTWVTEKNPFSRPPSSWTSDPDDTIRELQMQIARALVPRLAARGDRVGLLAFIQRAEQHQLTRTRHVDRPTIEAPVGGPEAVLSALDEIPPPQARRRFDLARALKLAEGLLAAAPGAEPDRPRAILLLSLGRPSAPDGIHWASQRALETARRLGAGGTQIWAIPFGGADVSFLTDLTDGTGGRVVPLAQLAQLLAAARAPLEPAS
ncbi:MAG: vWA domain-containing protein [Myxococcota bacterium]|nr:vWA domain-containing protein [Myxococcota bacterium]